MPIQVIITDITRLSVDAIVNAAHASLLGGGGVDGAIHCAAGPRLLAACRALPELAPGVRCPTGEARLTPGFELPAQHVIHTVGPIWYGGQHGEPALLATCYRHALQLLRQHRLRTIAFPAISCGVYGYPAEAAARIAVASVRAELADHPAIEVQLCAFSETMGAILRHALSED
jgi:O-acetyl-ADP-ribose deacetylase (regulator of RNase III)